MDLYVETDGQSTEEMFFVTLVNTDSNISMIRYERMTTYSKYNKCCDKGVDVKICICDSPNERVENKKINTSVHRNVLTNILYSNLKHNITSIRVHDDVCLFLIEQFNEYDIVYEAFNDCNSTLTLRLFFRPVNIKLSPGSMVSVKMFSGDIKFLAAGVSSEKWSCHVNVDIKI